MNSLFWHKLRAQGASPSPREGCSYIYNARDKNWVLFGGIGDRRSNEVFTYDSTAGTWEVVEAEGSIPCGRGYHVSWIDEVHNIMFIHGGQGDRRDSLADLYALDLDQWVWKKLYIIEQPTGRAHHAACKLQERIFMYGGCSAPENLMLDDLWAFQYNDIDWSASGTEVPGPSWARQKTKGTSPGPRKGHTLCSFQDTLILFGGVTTQKYSSDLFILNVNELRWIKTQPRGKGPSPRAFHSTAILDNFCVAIFGGVESLREGRAERLNILNDFYILDLSEMHWSVPIMGGYCPNKRYGHAMSWGMNAEGKSQLLLLGGLEQAYCVMEIFSLEKTEVTSGQAWQVASPQFGDKSSLAKAEATITEQMKKIKELQNQLSINRDKIVILENEKQSLAEKLDHQTRENRELQINLGNKIAHLESINKKKSLEIESIKKSHTMTDQKDKLMIERVEKLEDMVKKAESLLITLDHSFAEMIAMNAGTQIRGLSKERMDDIALRKRKHQESLIKLREFYQLSIEENDTVDYHMKEEDIEESYREEMQEEQDSLEDSLDEA